MTQRPLGLAVLALSLPALAACSTTSGGKSAGGGAVTVTSTKDECTVSAASAPSGRLAFSVKNAGNEVTEFYLYAQDGLRILGEVENIGPGLTRDLVLRMQPGSYLAACKPGMVGKGIRKAFTVTDSGVQVAVAGEEKALLDTANQQYANYVKDQTEQLLSATGTFVGLYQAGRDDEARTLYADARVHWERIEPVAESFGDLDPKMDLREADLEVGQQWTGWHRIEKDLWPPAAGYRALTTSERKRVSDQLLADTTELHQRTRSTTFTAD